MQLSTKSCHNNKEGQLTLIKGKKLPRRTLNSEHPYSKRKSNNISKRNFTKAQSTHCTSHNNSRRLQDSTLINGQILETETKQRHSKTNRRYEINGFNRYLKHFILKQKNIPSSQHIMVTFPKLAI